jgi:hypothetical protein
VLEAPLFPMRVLVKVLACFFFLASTAIRLAIICLLGEVKLLSHASRVGHGGKAASFVKVGMGVLCLRIALFCVV